MASGWKPAKACHDFNNDFTLFTAVPVLFNINKIYYYKMAKEMNVRCNFLENNLMCILPKHTMDVLLKVRTRSGEHTFQEDVYTRTLKYRRWNNELRPFCSLKKRVANMFKKGICFQTVVEAPLLKQLLTILNNVKWRQEIKTVRWIVNRDSIHSNWNELIPITNE